MWVLEPLDKSDDKAEKARVAADRKKKKAKSPKKGRPVAAPGKGTANAPAKKPDTEQTKKAAQAMQIVERAKADKKRIEREKAAAEAEKKKNKGATLYMSAQDLHRAAEFASVGHEYILPADMYESSRPDTKAESGYILQEIRAAMEKSSLPRMKELKDVSTSPRLLSSSPLHALRFAPAACLTGVCTLRGAEIQNVSKPRSPGARDV